MINPIDNPGQIAAEGAVIALWQDDRIKAARNHLGQLWRAGWGDSVPAEIEPHVDQAIDEYLTNWMIKAVASDGHYPRFVRDFMPPHHWHGRDVPGARAGGDNPDNCYRLAGIEHGQAYRVTGRVLDREPANVSFTLTGDYGTTVTIQTVENHQLDRAADGSFVITIDDQPANGRRNHMTTAPHVKFLYIRDSMEDWAVETPFDLDIELVGDPGLEPISTDEIVRRAVQRSREDVGLYHWFQTGFTLLKPNALRPVDKARRTGGLVTQATARAWWEIGPDDAVIIDYDPAGAAYVSIELSNYLFRSLDAGEITSSLTRAQCAVSGDGRVRAVISITDPGVANWLDCQGFTQVMMMHRWQGLPSQPVNEGPHVRAEIVKIADLRAKLPADTVWFDAQQRAEQIAARRAAFDRRYLINS
jgi:hypothetical protein